VFRKNRSGGQPLEDEAVIVDVGRVRGRREAQVDRPTHDACEASRISHDHLRRVGESAADDVRVRLQQFDADGGPAHARCTGSDLLHRGFAEVDVVIRLGVTLLHKISELELQSWLHVYIQLATPSSRMTSGRGHDMGSEAYVLVTALALAGPRGNR
jgi:hypothetical protein